MSVYCPTWPPQAADWPIIIRHHGWPDQPTINLVVSGGCHVVGAVHPNCRDDHWESKYQWTGDCRSREQKLHRIHQPSGQKSLLLSNSAVDCCLNSLTVSQTDIVSIISSAAVIFWTISSKMIRGKSVTICEN